MRSGLSDQRERNCSPVHSTSVPLGKLSNHENGKVFSLLDLMLNFVSAVADPALGEPRGYACWIRRKPFFFLVENIDKDFQIYYW